MKPDKPHTLSATRSRPLPSELIFLDTETDLVPIGDRRTAHRLKLGIAQHCQREGDAGIFVKSECRFYDRGDFYSWLAPLLVGNQTFYLIAHNIPYDAMILDAFRELPRRGFTLQSLYSKGQVTIIRWKKDKTRLIMLDNGNIFGGTLERWGDIFKVPKLQIDFEHCTLEELEIYCRRDVEIMLHCWRAWYAFLVEHQCGGFRMTVGATAFNTWRHAHMTDDVYVHKDRRALELERAAYHGGRVECFFQGRLTDGPYYYLDINNMYGHVMRSGRYPIGLQGYSERLKISRMINYLERYAVIARVTVNVDVPAYVTKVDGYTAYPLGRFETTLTTDEIILALRCGWLETLHAMAWYRTGFIFRSYVEHFYNLRMNYRDQGDQGFEQIAKLLINSLYGKFGQRGIEQRVIGRAAPETIWSSPVHHITSGRSSRLVILGGTVYEEFSEGESFHAMPAIAAHVTANARLYLLSLIERAGWENVYYTDTYSLIVNRAGYFNLEALIKPDTIGMLKVETEGDVLELYAAKEYRLGDRLRLKGIRKNAREIAPGLFEQERWPRLAGQIRAGMPGEYITETIEKHQARRVTSGTVTPEGWVKPFHLR